MQERSIPSWAPMEKPSTDAAGTTPGTTTTSDAGYAGRPSRSRAREFEEWAAKIGERYGYSLVEHMIELTGICEACAAKEG